jgi:hypothetical protein
VFWSVVATSSAPLQYQWRFNHALLPGATNTTLLLTNVQPSQAGAYSVVVLNAAGSVVSDLATLTLLIPAAILAQPTNVSVRIPPDPQAAATTNAIFRVVASSSSPLRYQWRFNGANIPGATNSSLTISDVQAGDWGEYTAAITDDVSTVLSVPAWLYPLVRPSFVQGPLNQRVAVGSGVSLSAEATGWPPPFTFEWRLVSTVLASNALSLPKSFFTFTATNVVTIQQYRAVIKNAALPGGIAASANVTTLADSDHDGMPDEWEILYNFTPTNATDRLEDLDGDGMLNGQEYTAGTDPTNALSRLAINFLALSNGWALSFEAASNKTYTVQSQDALNADHWLKLTDVLARTSNHVEWLLDSTIATNRFYRVVTPQQP